MNWIETTVGEYCPFIYGKGLPKSKRNNGEYLVYGSNGAVDSHSEPLINNHGIIIGRKGSVGAVHLSDKPFWPIDTSFYVVKDSLDELRFVYYLLKSLSLETMNSDSAVPGLNRDNAHSIKIRIPEKLSDRELLGYRIATFDLKITNNTQTNQTLEAMAQAIFKSWFVDFDPVHHKMHHKAQAGTNDAQNANTTSYSLPQEILDLFPDNLVESELGLIPEGWEVKNLEQLVEISSSKRIFAKEYEKLGVPFYRGKEITELSRGNNVIPEIYISEERYQEIKNKFGAPKKHDILITSVGTIGNTYLVDDEDKFYFKDGNLTWIKDYKEALIPFFLMEWFKSPIGKFAIENVKIGSTQQAITIASLNKLKLINPTIDIHQEFNSLIEPIFNMHKKNIKQNEQLANLRDTLLPKLLSGEIDLAEPLRGVTEIEERQAEEQVA